MLIDREPARPEHVRPRVYLNPWATSPMRAGSLGVRAFAVDEARTQAARQSNGQRTWVLRWHDQLAGTWEIG
jgi:hypothetical protein